MIQCSPLSLRGAELMIAKKYFDNLLEDKFPCT